MTTTSSGLAKASRSRAPRPGAARDNPAAAPGSVSPAVAHFKHLTEHVLPTLAREQRWPLRLDHCFKRVCLDYAFSDVWYRHLPRPAERHLTGEPLRRAVACAEAIAHQGRSLLVERNRESLVYRGKLPPVTPA